MRPFYRRSPQIFFSVSVTFCNTDVYSAYCIVVITSPSNFEAHAGLFRLLMKGIFGPYVLTKSGFPN